jgi:hypothetical protein
MLGRTLKLTSLTLLLVAASLATTIPAGTRLTVRIDSQINSGSAKVGQSFHGNLVHALVVGGNTIAPASAPVKGKVTYVKPSGRLHAPGELTIRLTSVEVNGQQVAIATTGYRAKGKSHTKSNVEKIGGGAAAGALIGGLAGGGKGALIGTGVGAAAGTGVAAATGKEEAVIHAETSIGFTTTTNTTTK